VVAQLVEALCCKLEGQFFSLEDSLEVLGDDKCFVVLYFELAKIEIVLPFYFLPFTFILLFIFCIFVLYCIACTVCDVIL
jgi:hypothetical protein